MRKDRVKAVYFNFDRKICEDMDLCEGVRLKLRRRGVSVAGGNALLCADE